MSAHAPQVVDSSEFIDILDYAFTGDSATVDNKRRIVEGYRLKASIYHAAQLAGVHRATVYRYLDNDPQFAQAMADSFEDSADILETSVYERALKSDLLAMFWLKAHRPKFRDKLQVDIEQVDSEIKERIRLAGNVPLLPQFTSESESKQKD